MERPRPRNPPVTTATFPSSLNIYPSPCFATPLPSNERAAPGDSTAQRAKHQRLPREQFAGPRSLVERDRYGCARRVRGLIDVDEEAFHWNAGSFLYGFQNANVCLVRNDPVDLGRRKPVGFERSRHRGTK